MFLVLEVHLKCSSFNVKVPRELVEIIGKRRIISSFSAFLLLSLFYTTHVWLCSPCAVFPSGLNDDTVTWSPTGKTVWPLITPTYNIVINYLCI